MDLRTRRLVLFGSKKKSKVKKSRGKQPGKRLIVLGLVAALLAGLYCTAVFSNIPFVKKWRTIYIETAMDTYSHKWLATFFIPQSVIDAVIDNKDAYIEEQQDLQSSWGPASGPASEQGGEAAPSSGDKEETALLDRFYELDKDSLDSYIALHPEALADGWDKLLINKTGPKDAATDIYTVNGDQVVVLDAENGILIVKVTGDGYAGKLAIVKNPAQVRVGVAETLGVEGQTVGRIAKNNHAVLAINASGFADPEWKGNGGQVVGLLISGGKTYNEPVKNGYLNLGFSRDDRFYIGLSTEKIQYRDAVEFIPALIINGKNVTDGSMGFGIQPRSAIGQSKDGTVFLLTIDGRQVG
jgi:exopolysaccharide biosynthesis protein